MKKLVISLLCAVIVNTQLAFAWDYEKVLVDGFYYNLDSQNQIAEVTESDNYEEKYSGAISIPASVTYSGITYTITSIGDLAFSGCKDLTSIVIPYSISDIGEIPFYQSENLNKIVVDANNPKYDSRNNCNAIIETASNKLVVGCNSTVIPDDVTSLGYRAFAGCTLKQFTFPDNITELTNIVFYNCFNLTSVTLGSRMTFIEWDAFLGSDSLESVTCYTSTPPQLNVIGVWRGPCMDYETGETYTCEYSTIIYVPTGSVDAYKAAEDWKSFPDIRAIPSSGGSSGGSTPMFPGDPGTLTYSLELNAEVEDGDELPDYAPTGGGGYPQGSEVTITAKDIPGYEFVRWSDEVTDNPRTIVLNESMTLTALYNHSMIEIPIAANRWNFICLPPLGDRQYTAAMFTYDGLTGVKWGTYNGSKRTVGQSGWETPESFNALQGYILYSTTAGTLRINAYEDDIRQGDSDNTIYAGMIAYASSHPENESWNFLGNPYNQGYNIAGLAAAGVESPITVWNGTGYTTYTPGIDSYILNPFEAFFIQKAEGTEGITFSREYLEENVEGTLSGYFSVSESTKIRFSKGNLQYQASTDTWRFAENQYDTIGALNANISAIYDGWIDLFGWGTGDNPTKSSTGDNDYNTFVDWGTNTISNGGNEANQWRTLTGDEYVYMFETREKASVLFGLASLNGINGIMILPDDWQGVPGISFTSGTSSYSQNTYSLEQWSKLESAGAVFLPAAGVRSGTKVGSVGSDCGVWSASPYDSYNARNIFYNTNGFSLYGFACCYAGNSVRLVR